MRTVALIARRLPNARRYPLLHLLSRDPRNAAAAATLAAQADGAAAIAAAGTDPAARTAAVRGVQDKLVALAAAYPDFWPLQREVIVHLLQSGQTDRAADAAWKATAAFPGTPEPARLAAEAYAARGRWANVVDAATAWRQRSGADPVPADVMMADAFIAQRQPLLAVRRLEGHVRAAPLSDAATSNPVAATAPPDAGSPAVPPATLALYTTYGRALLASGRDAEAVNALGPLLSVGPTGRAAWLSLAGFVKLPPPPAPGSTKGAAGIGADSPADQRLAVAAAYFEAGRRTGDATLLATAAAAAEPLAAGRRASPLRPARAQAAHFLGDYATAEQAWRTVRRAVANPDPDVLNNLAYVLLVRGNPNDLAEATRLAQQAVSASPDVPAFAGTLALARSRNGDRAGAVQTYRQVLVKQTDNVDALLGLAGELLEGESPKTEPRPNVCSSKSGASRDEDGAQPPESRKQFEALAVLADK